MASYDINNVRIRFTDPYTPINVVFLVIVALYTFQLQLTSNPGDGHIGYRQYGGLGVIRLGDQQKSKKYGLGNISDKYGAFGQNLNQILYIMP